MATTRDRVGDLLNGFQYDRRSIVSPEGVELDIKIAGRGGRFGAFLIDILFMYLAIIGLYLIIVPLAFSGTTILVGLTVIQFLGFIVRNLYFIYFETMWQGRTPGKNICGLRVINRNGGELTSAAIIARNLTREVEFFLPFGLYISLDTNSSFLQQATLIGWFVIIGSLPLFNRERLRAGDLIAGTQVIVSPRHTLLADLSVQTPTTVESSEENRFVFSHEQLSIYGVFELQVLEEFLRRPESAETERLLNDVCEKICNKINWRERVPMKDTRRFLTDFYVAERAALERGQLFGKYKADKNSV